MILRIATFADEKLLLDWRNDETVRMNSLHSEFISAESHHFWLSMVMNDTMTALYIAEANGVPVGQGRIERAWKAISKKMDSALISYSIAMEYRKKGYGKQLAIELVKLAKGVHDYRSVMCRVRRGNMCSVAIAIKAGVDTIEIF